MDEIVRPSPLQWFRYVWTGSVPARSHAWVLYDATCRTWWLRHIVRFLIQIAPIIALIVIFLPAPLGLRIGVAVAGILGTVVFAFGYTIEGIERRVEKAGYRYGSAASLREHQSIESQRVTAQRNRDRRQARLERRTRRNGTDS